MCELPYNLFDQFFQELFLKRLLLTRLVSIIQCALSIVLIVSSPYKCCFMRSVRLKLFVATKKRCSQSCRCRLKFKTVEVVKNVPKNFSLSSVFIMKSSNLFAFFALAVIIKENLAGSIKKNGEHSFIASSIGEIIEKFYGKNDHRVDLLCYPCKTTKSVELFNEILKHNTNVTFGVLKPGKSVQINTSTIMIFDNENYHVMFVRNISFDLLSTTEKYYVIYYPKLKENQILMYINMEYKNCNYLSNHNKTHLELFTHTYYNKNKCDLIWGEAINFFNKAEKKWQNETDFFPDKFRNFNNCPLNYGRENSVGQFEATDPRKGQKFGGDFYEMNEAITKQLKIKSNYVLCPRDESTRIYVCNKTHPIEPEMYLQIWYVPTSTQSEEQLVSFNFESYAGFLIPPGKILFDKIVFQYHFSSPLRLALHAVRKNVHDV
jgi:hypothetical protein